MIILAQANTYSRASAELHLSGTVFLGQIATGNGSEHMKEQMASFQVCSLSTPSFITLEYNMGTLFEEMVTKQLLTAGQKEKQLAIQQGNYNDSRVCFPPVFSMLRQ